MVLWVLAGCLQEQCSLLLSSSSRQEERMRVWLREGTGRYLTPQEWRALNWVSERQKHRQ
jgi:hypothetical protein